MRKPLIKNEFQVLYVRLTGAQHPKFIVLRFPVQLSLVALRKFDFMFPNSLKPFNLIFPRNRFHAWANEYSFSTLCETFEL